MDLETAKLSMVALIQSLSTNDRESFIKWIQSTSYDTLSDYKGQGDANISPMDDWDCESPKVKESLLVLEAIRQELQGTLPLSCTLDSETIMMPKGSDTCGDDHSLVEHIDSFVYDDDDLDIACEMGKFSRSYCPKCGCKDIQDLDFISHSLSVEQVKFISRCLLSDYADKVMLDIGSRTGAILYGAALFSSLKKSVGVEIVKEFADISRSLVEKYNMADRVVIINEDILNCCSQIQQADIVVMNNVFEFFKDKKTQSRLWRFCLDEIRKRPGRVLISLPAVEKSLADAHISYDTSFLQSISIEDKIDSYIGVGESNVDEESLHSIHVYRVL